MIEIPRRSLRCTTCDKRFEPGAEIITLLVEGEDSLERLDTCPSCRQEKEAWAEWTTHLPTKVEEDHVLGERETQILDLLKDHLQKGERGMAYLLALYLRRIGAARRIRPFTGETLIFEVKATGECLEISEPQGNEVTQIDLESDVIMALEGADGVSPSPA